MLASIVGCVTADGDIATSQAKPECQFGLESQNYGKKKTFLFKRHDLRNACMICCSRCTLDSAAAGAPYELALELLQKFCRCSILLRLIAEEFRVQNSEDALQICV